MKILYFDSSVHFLCDVIQMLIFHLGEIQNHLPKLVHNACKWLLGISVRSESDCTRVIWTLRLLLIGKLHLFIAVNRYLAFFYVEQLAWVGEFGDLSSLINCFIENHQSAFQKL